MGAKSIAGTETAPLPQTKKEDIQVRVEAPIVFRASDLPPAGTSDSKDTAGGTKSNTAPTADPTAPVPSMPPSASVTAKKAEHKGFFGKIGGFFAAIFR